MDSEGTYTWYTYAKSLSSDIGLNLEEIESCNSDKLLNTLKRRIKKEVDNYYEKILTNKIKNLMKTIRFIYTKI